MVDIVLGTRAVILELAEGTLLSVPLGDPEPEPQAPYTTVHWVYTADGNDYYLQGLTRDGAFTPTP